MLPSIPIPLPTWPPSAPTSRSGSPVIGRARNSGNMNNADKFNYADKFKSKSGVKTELQKSFFDSISRFIPFFAPTQEDEDEGGGLDLRSLSASSNTSNLYGLYEGTLVMMGVL
jgi:hypothetical protein